jgi:4-amino-4-deoxy-L-arabinose transferase-like glycosyltransferase
MVPELDGAADARRRASIWPPILFAVALAIALCVIVGSLPSAARDANSDDGYYLLYMKALHERGLGAFPGLFDLWNGDPARWIYPPPSRIGFAVVSALWAGLFGVSLDALQYLSIAAHVVSSIATYLFARRHLGEPNGLFVGVLWLFSPLLMGLSRLALTDSFIALCMSLSTWLFYELLLRPESWRARVAFVAAFSFTVLVKELSVLLVVPFSAFLLVERFVRREPVKLGTFAACFAASGVVALPLFVLAAGNPSKLFETTRIVLASPATNDYAIRYGSGPWFRYVIDFLLLSPVTTLLAIAFLGVLVTRLRRGEYDRLIVLLSVLAIVMIALYSSFTKNVRYAVLLELPISVFSVCMLNELFGSASTQRRIACCAVAILGIAWLDWSCFDLYWVRYHGYDPVSYWLAGMRHIIPFPVR